MADCETCQRNKGEIVAYPRLLQPLPISSRAWEHIAMDFIRLPKTYGKDSVLVVIDRYTKFAHFFALTHPYMATQVAQIFLDNVCKLHGLLNSIVSDRDPIFGSNFWKELFKGLKMEKRKDRNFEIGDWVFLKLQPYRQSLVPVRKNLKLSARYFGPYELKKKIGEKVLPTQDPPYCTNEGQILTEPLQILDRRMVKKKNKVVVEVLVHKDLLWGSRRMDSCHFVSLVVIFLAVIFCAI
ncbi:uncharacterized protein [Nicotiana sylvestris]|uniref:uncharacterized protein n=1 Tax=Nicotiana sylvestris TaxID=4096 RepID=UPI00388C741F